MNTRHATTLISEEEIFFKKKVTLKQVVDRFGGKQNGKMLSTLKLFMLDLLSMVENGSTIL